MAGGDDKQSDSEVADSSDWVAGENVGDVDQASLDDPVMAELKEQESRLANGLSSIAGVDNNFANTSRSTWQAQLEQVKHEITNRKPIKNQVESLTGTPF